MKNLVSRAGNGVCLAAAYVLMGLGNLMLVVWPSRK
jgi:hypothetical protein